VNVRGDFLVIGSGVAGLRAAISLAESGTVTILTKAGPSESNTGYAQGGIAAALGADDSTALHLTDTIGAGDGLCHQAAVRVLVEDGIRDVLQLLEWGAAFDRDETGRLALAREGAHAVRRVLHARDATGQEIARVLWERVVSTPRIQVLDGARAVSLIVRAGICQGATFVDRTGQTRQADATATLLATGGAGHVFAETTNPSVTTGDGMAMAFLAGARVVDMEFVQFHPTVLQAPNVPRFLLSEALRGEGARLINVRGEAFMSRYEAAGDLASRDLVARAIVRESERTGAPVFLSVTHLNSAFVRGRFPTIARACDQAGLDLTADPIPVGPAAHYIMGGVETDLQGRTSVPGLFAAGEVACTGVHGANRLASNSLLEGLVFGARAAHAMSIPFVVPAWPHEADPVYLSSGVTGEVPTVAGVRDLMWRQVGMVRDRSGLLGAVTQLQAWVATSLASPVRLADESCTRAATLATVGLLIAQAALRRTESRGAHFRADAPVRDDIHWLRHVADVRIG
jgi:L-aspartate oxidase